MVACAWFIFVSIIAFKVTTAIQPTEMSSVQLATSIPGPRAITFPIPEILPGHPSWSHWCPPLLLDF